MVSERIHPRTVSLREMIASTLQKKHSAAEPRSRKRIDEIRVEISDGEVLVFEVGREEVREIARLPEADAERIGPAMLDNNLQKRNFAETSVFLSPSEAFRRSVRLPAAAAGSLREILRHELERQSPIDPKDVFFDYSVRDRNKAANRLEVELRIVKRHSIERAIALCRSLGLEPVTIGIKGDDFPFKRSELPLNRWALRRAA